MAADTQTDADRDALRRQHGVRLVTEAEEGFAAEQLPAGVYGFTGSPVLASPLFAQRRYRNFEVHHLADATVALIAFVSSAEATQLDSSTAVFTMTAYPDAEADATTIVAIPYSRIVQHRQYAIRNSAGIALQIKPADQVLGV